MSFFAVERNIVMACIAASIATVWKSDFIPWQMCLHHDGRVCDVG